MGLIIYKNFHFTHSTIKMKTSLSFILKNRKCFNCVPKANAIPSRLGIKISLIGHNGFDAFPTSISIISWFLAHSFKLKCWCQQNYFGLILQVTVFGRQAAHQCHWCILKQEKCWPMLPWMFLHTSRLKGKSIFLKYLLLLKNANTWRTWSLVDQNNYLNVSPWVSGLWDVILRYDPSSYSSHCIFLYLHFNFKWQEKDEHFKYLFNALMFSEDRDELFEFAWVNYMVYFLKKYLTMYL